MDSIHQVIQWQLGTSEVALVCEVDEQWSLVKTKKNQRWLWYAYDSNRKSIIAHAFGSRDSEILKVLLKLL